MLRNFLPLIKPIYEHMPPRHERYKFSLETTIEIIIGPQLKLFTQTTLYGTDCPLGLEFTNSIRTSRLCVPQTQMIFSENSMEPIAHLD